MNEIYVLKSDINFDDLIKLGFEEAPLESAASSVFVKPIVFDYESELPQSLINNFYKNPKWKKKIYDPNRDLIREELGISYEKGELIISDQLKEIVCEWRIQIDLQDMWIGFTSGDPFDQQIFYGKPILDKYCSDIIKDMEGLIEVVEVE